MDSYIAYKPFSTSFVSNGGFIYWATPFYFATGAFYLKTTLYFMTAFLFHDSLSFHDSFSFTDNFFFTGSFLFTGRFYIYWQRFIYWQPKFLSTDSFLITGSVSFTGSFFFYWQLFISWLLYLYQLYYCIISHLLFSRRPTILRHQLRRQLKGSCTKLGHMQLRMYVKFCQCICMQYPQQRRRLTFSSKGPFWHRKSAQF